MKPYVVETTPGNYRTVLADTVVVSHGTLCLTENASDLVFAFAAGAWVSVRPALSEGEQWL